MSNPESSPAAAAAPVNNFRLDLSTDLTFPKTIEPRFGSSGMFIGLFLPDGTILRPILTFEQDPQGSGENYSDLTVAEVAKIGIEVFDARQSIEEIDLRCGVRGPLFRTNPRRGSFE